EAKVLREHAPSYEQFEEQVIARAQPFRDRWGVWPPQTGELLDPDPRRRAVEAIASGNWGIVLLFPWTTDREIHACIKKIRSTISKWHKDSLDFHTAQLERWLEECGAGFGRKAIVRAVRRRTKALHRPTTSQAFARADRETPGRPDELFEKYQQQYRELGIDETAAYTLANQRVERALRGSEAPAHAALRMAGSRYRNRLKELNAD